MATFSIKATGIEAIQAKIAEPKFKAAINTALNAFALSSVNDAKQLAPNFEGTIRKNINFDEATNYVTTINVNVDYAAYVEFGTKKFSASYVSGLPRDWQSFAAEFKGKGNGSFSQFVERLTYWAKKTGKIPVEAAYVTALKILREGVKPQPFLFPAINKNLPQLTKDLNNAIQ